MKTIRVVAAIIEKDDRILIAKRLKGEFEGLWEFPGGKIEIGETPEEALIREIKEEFDADISVDDFVCTVEHEYSTFYLIMDCFSCHLLDTELHLHDHSAYQWIDSKEHIIDWVPADVKVITNYNNKKNEK